MRGERDLERNRIDRASGGSRLFGHAESRANGAPVDRLRVRQRHLQQACLKPDLAGPARMQRFQVRADAIESIGVVGHLRHARPAIHVHAAGVGQQCGDTRGQLVERVRGWNARRERGRVPDGAGALPVALDVEDVEVEDSGFGPPRKHADHGAVEVVRQPVWREHRFNRLTQGDVLQFAGERALRRGVDRDAERRASNEQEQRVPNGHRVGERHGQPLRVVELRETRPLVEPRHGNAAKGWARLAAPRGPADPHERRGCRQADDAERAARG